MLRPRYSDSFLRQGAPRIRALQNEWVSLYQGATSVVPLQRKIKKGFSPRKG